MNIAPIERIIYRTEQVYIILSGFILGICRCIMIMITDQVKERNVISSVGCKPGHDVMHRFPLNSIVECNISHGHNINILILTISLRCRNEISHIRQCFSPETLHIRIGLTLRISNSNESEILLRCIKRLQDKVISVLLIILYF